MPPLFPVASLGPRAATVVSRTGLPEDLVPHAARSVPQGVRRNWRGAALPRCGRRLRACRGARAGFTRTASSVCSAPPGSPSSPARGRLETGRAILRPSRRQPRGSVATRKRTGRARGRRTARWPRHSKRRGGGVFFEGQGPLAAGVRCRAGDTGSQRRPGIRRLRGPVVTRKRTGRVRDRRTAWLPRHSKRGGAAAGWSFF